MFQNFYFETSRKYIIAFGALFNSIVITRTDDTGTVVQSLKVPLSYAPKDKMLARMKQDTALDREMAISLPRMSFEMKAYAYDGDRKLNTIKRVVRKDDTNANKFKHQYNPVPYNIHFELYVYVKNAEDGTKIIEQILPYFTPEWNFTMNIIPEMDIMLDIPLILDGITPEDTYEGDFVTRRALVWTLGFTLKGMFYGPVRKSPIIKFSKEQFYFGNPNENTQSDIVSTIQVTPGLLANGLPTTNAALSISPLAIFEDDDFDICIQKSGMVIVEE